MTTSGQETNVGEAFSLQSAGFDELEIQNEILRWMRERVRTHVLKIARPGRMLELNCGTGLDAVFFARHGFTVHATDIAPGMLDQLRRKVETEGLDQRITVQQCSFHDIGSLSDGRFDHIFSNFGGLNCSDDLSAAIRAMKPLVVPGGTVTLVIMPPVCPWELLTALKGNTRLAFRRFRKGGADSNVEGVHFRTWYYPPRYVRHAFGGDFEVLALFGLAAVHPPPNFENFPKKFPRLSSFLRKADELLSSFPLFRSMADHYVLTFRKKPDASGPP